MTITPEWGARPRTPNAPSGAISRQIAQLPDGAERFNAADRLDEGGDLRERGQAGAVDALPPPPARNQVSPELIQRILDAFNKSVSPSTTPDMRAEFERQIRESLSSHSTNEEATVLADSMEKLANSGIQIDVVPTADFNRLIPDWWGGAGEHYMPFVFDSRSNHVTLNVTQNTSAQPANAFADISPAVQFAASVHTWASAGSQRSEDANNFNSSFTNFDVGKSIDDVKAEALGIISQHPLGERLIDHLPGGSGVKVRVESMEEFHAREEQMRRRLESMTEEELVELQNDPDAVEEFLNMGGARIEDDVVVLPARNRTAKQFAAALAGVGADELARRDPSIEPARLSRQVTQLAETSDEDRAAIQKVRDILASTKAGAEILSRFDKTGTLITTADQLHMIGEQSAAYYDPMSKILVMPRQIIHEDPRWATTLFAHEATHAIDDSEGGLHTERSNEGGLLQQGGDFARSFVSALLNPHRPLAAFDEKFIEIYGERDGEASVQQELPAFAAGTEVAHELGFDDAEIEERMGYSPDEETIRSIYTELAKSRYPTSMSYPAWAEAGAIGGGALAAAGGVKLLAPVLRRPITAVATLGGRRELGRAASWLTAPHTPRGRLGALGALLGGVALVSASSWLGAKAVAGAYEP